MIPSIPHCRIQRLHRWCLSMAETTAFLWCEKLALDSGWMGIGSTDVGPPPPLPPPCHRHIHSLPPCACRPPRISSLSLLRLPPKHSPRNCHCDTAVRAFARRPGPDVAPMRIPIPETRGGLLLCLANDLPAAMVACLRTGLSGQRRLLPNPLCGLGPYTALGPVHPSLRTQLRV